MQIHILVSENIENYPTSASDLELILLLKFGSKFDWINLKSVIAATVLWIQCICLFVAQQKRKK